MNEIENASTVEEQPADQQSAFLDGWGDDTPETEQPADQQDTPDAGAQEERVTDSEGAAAEGEQTEQTVDETTSGAAADGTDGKGQETAPTTWTVKHMGEEKTLGAADITPELLQKGLDYDRVRVKYDEAKPALELLSQYAKQANMSLADYAKHLRVQAKLASGMTAEDAQRTVELEDREAAVSAKETEQQENAKGEADRKAKVAADLAEFEKAFPDIYAKAKNGDPNAIPKSVWDEVNSGKFSLTAAYSRYAVAQAAEQARAAVQTAAQNQKNAQRSTGSQKSAGADTKSTNAFLEGFDE